MKIKWCLTKSGYDLAGSYRNDEWRFWADEFRFKAATVCCGQDLSAIDSWGNCVTCKGKVAQNVHRKTYKTAEELTSNIFPTLPALEQLWLAVLIEAHQGQLHAAFSRLATQGELRDEDLDEMLDIIEVFNRELADVVKETSVL